MLDAALESLSEQECLTLLKSVKYGHVAVVTNQGRPEIRRLYMPTPAPMFL